MHKDDYIQSISAMIQERSSSHEIYFMTFTFTHMRQERPIDDYLEFFQYFRQRLDNSLLSNNKKHHRRPVLILYPEQHPALHFHGFLLVHKDTSDKFNSKCVKNITSEYIEALDCYKPSLELNKKFTEPYPKARYKEILASSVIRETKLKSRTRAQKLLMQRTRPALRIQSMKIHPLYKEDEYGCVTSYCMKHFDKDFTYDDVIVETKDKKFEEDVFFLSRRLVSSGNKVTIERIIKRYLFQLTVLYQVKDASLALSMISNV
jgi:hypothetical protein